MDEGSSSNEKIPIVENSLPIVELTEEQKRFLEECEIEFADRYTDKDPDFVNTSDTQTPPIVDPWYHKTRRNYNWPRQGHAHRRHEHYGGRNDRWQNQGGYEHHRQGYRYQQRHRPY